MFRNGKSIFSGAHDSESLRSARYVRLDASFHRLEVDSLPLFSEDSFSSRRHFGL